MVDIPIQMTYIDSMETKGNKMNYLPISGYMLDKVQRDNGYRRCVWIGGSLIYDGDNLVGYAQLVDQDEDRYFYDHFIREDYFPHDLVKAERERIDAMLARVKK